MAIKRLEIESYSFADYSVSVRMNPVDASEIKLFDKIILEDYEEPMHIGTQPIGKQQTTM